MTIKCKDCETNTIIRLSDGQIAVWIRKTRTAITIWSKTGVMLNLDTEVEIVKFPAELAADYLRQNQITL